MTNSEGIDILSWWLSQPSQKSCQNWISIDLSKSFKKTLRTMSSWSTWWNLKVTNQVKIQTTHIKTQPTSTCHAPKKLQQFSEGIEVPKKNLDMLCKERGQVVDMHALASWTIWYQKTAHLVWISGGYLLIIFTTTVNIKGWTESVFHGEFWIDFFLVFFSWLFQEVSVRILRWSIDLWSDLNIDWEIEF